MKPNQTPTLEFGFAYPTCKQPTPLLYDYILWVD